MPLYLQMLNIKINFIIPHLLQLIFVVLAYVSPKFVLIPANKFFFVAALNLELF